MNRPLRSRRLRWLGVAMSLIVSLGAESNERPNIVLIYTDDQGYGDVSALNPEAKFTTPHLDRLVREGIAFTNAHSADTVCTPSRYSILTGRYCWRTERKRGVLGAEAPCLIAEGRVTLASALRERGYATAMVGKWHLGMDFPGEAGDRNWEAPVRDMPLDKGFDYFYGIPASLNYGVLAWFEGRKAQVPPTLYTAKKPNRRHLDYRIKPPYEASPEETQRKLGKPGMEVAPDFIDDLCLTRFTDRALSWLEGRAEAAQAGTPFFLYLPLTSPHYPVCPKPEFWGQGDAGAYGEFMIETDHHVGRVLRFLDEAGLAETTLVVFTSDNGPENSWKERMATHGHDSRGGWRGGKRSIYEGGHRVPFIVRWPAGIREPGRRWNGVVGQVDLLATVAEIVGLEQLPAAVGEDSQSFAQVLTDPAATPARLPLINHAANGRFAITEGHWKLVLPHRQAPAELYHLHEDPVEARNVIEAHRVIAERLEKRATEIVCRGRTTEGAWQANDTGYWQDLAWLTEEAYEKTLRQGRTVPNGDTTQD